MSDPLDAKARAQFQPLLQPMVEELAEGVVKELRVLAPQIAELFDDLLSDHLARKLLDAALNLLEESGACNYDFHWSEGDFDGEVWKERCAACGQPKASHHQILVCPREHCAGKPPCDECLPSQLNRDGSA